MSEINEVKRQSEINGEMVNLEDAISTFSVMLDDLETNLRPVLRMSDPQPENCTPPEITLVPLANRIRVERNRILYNNDRLKDLLNRMEL